MAVETIVMDNPIIVNDAAQIDVVRSEPLDIGGVVAIGFTALDGAWTVADLCFEISPDRANWVLLTDPDGHLIRHSDIPTDQTWMRTFANPALIKPFRWMRLVSIEKNSTHSVTQESPRNIIVSKLYDVQSLRR